MCSYLQQKLSSLIIEEHNKLINIAYNIKLDDQRIFDINGEKLLIKVKENIPDFHELDKFGILVLGKTGVGKTTLINAILDQEEKGTTIGLPMTMKTPQIKHFNRSLFPSLDIWDSRGLELADEFSIEQNSQQVINFVKNGLKQDENENKSMNFIHCIWYCVTGTRIEKN
jgi:predicted GTPase